MDKKTHNFCKNEKCDVLVIYDVVWVIIVACVSICATLLRVGCVYILYVCLLFVWSNMYLVLLQV